MYAFHIIEECTTEQRMNTRVFLNSNEVDIYRKHDFHKDPFNVEDRALKKILRSLENK